MELQLPLHKSKIMGKRLITCFSFILIFYAHQMINVPQFLQVLIPCPGSMSFTGFWVFSYLKSFAKLMTAVLSNTIPRSLEDNEYVEAVL